MSDHEEIMRIDGVSDRNTMRGMMKLGGDWVPFWAGDLESWETYRIRSGIYCRGGDPNKLPQRINNLIQVLQGTAWDAIENLSEPEREKLQVNLETFHKFLKEQCLPTAIPELGRRFREYMKFRRSRKEPMQIYVKRCRLQLQKLEVRMRAIDSETALTKLRKLILSCA